MDEISFTSGTTAAPLGISRLPAKHWPAQTGGRVW